MITTDLTSADIAASRGRCSMSAAEKRRPLLQDRLLALHAVVRRARCRSRSRRPRAAGLAALAQHCGIELGFHNHAGYIGAALWDVAPAIDRLDPRWAGFYFDPRHAVAEGGGGAWKAATHLVMPRLKMVAAQGLRVGEGGPRAGRSRTARSAKASWTGPGSARRSASRVSSVPFPFTSNTTFPRERVTPWRRRRASWHLPGGAWW